MKGNPTSVISLGVIMLLRLKMLHVTSHTNKKPHLPRCGLSPMSKIAMCPGVHDPLRRGRCNRFNRGECTPGENESQAEIGNPEISANSARMLRSLLLPMPGACSPGHPYRGGCRATPLRSPLQDPGLAPVGRWPPVAGCRSTPCAGRQRQEGEIKSAKLESLALVSVEYRTGTETHLKYRHLPDRKQGDF